MTGEAKRAFLTIQVGAHDFAYVNVLAIDHIMLHGVSNFIAILYENGQWAHLEDFETEKKAQEAFQQIIKGMDVAFGFDNKTKVRVNLDD